MAAIKKAFVNTGAATSAYVSSPGDSASGRSSLATKFSNVRRRMYESTLQSLGKDSPSADNDYEAKKADLASVERTLASLKKNLTTQGDHLRAFCSASSGVGADAQFLFGEGGNVEPFTAALSRIDGDLRPTVDSTLLTDVLEPIERALASIDVSGGRTPACMSCLQPWLL